MESTRWRNRLIALTVIAAMPLGISQTALADSFNFVLFQYPGTHISTGSGINNNGQVVGFAAEAPGFTADPIGFLYDSGSFTPILVPGSTGTFANGINNHGVIVGNFITGALGAFIESSGTYTPILVPGSTGTFANGINDLGQVVGVSSAGGFLYDGSSFQTILGSPNGVNNLGQIVGDYTVGNKSVGFIDNAGVYTTIDVPGSMATHANGINNLGEVVGDYTDILGSHGFIYNNGEIIKFDAPGASSFPDGPSTHASGINDYGEITGTWAKSTSEFAYIATPVPEPGTIGLFGTGMMLAGAVRRKLLH